MDVLCDILTNFRGYTVTSRSPVELNGEDVPSISGLNRAGDVFYVFQVKSLLKNMCNAMIESVTCAQLIIVTEKSSILCLNCIHDVFLKVEIIPTYHLAYNILRHHTVPKYEIMEGGNHETLQLSVRGPVSMMLGLEPGMIVKETSSCPITGERVVFRRVT